MFQEFPVVRGNESQLQTLSKGQITFGLKTCTTESAGSITVTDTCKSGGPSTRVFFTLIGVESRCHLSPHQVILSGIRQSTYVKEEAQHAYPSLHQVSKNIRDIPDGPLAS